MDYCYIQPSTWMRDSLHIIGHKTLKEIVIPGTHNSSSYSFTKNYMPGTQSRFVESLINMINPVISGSISKLEMTQEHNVYYQLLAGARYLDIRAGWIYNKWVTYHCHISDDLQILLKHVRKFLNTHDSEIVIIEISHFKCPKGEKPNFEELKSMITSYLADHLHPVEDINSLTLISMLRKNKRAIVCIPKHYDENLCIWNNDIIKNTYPNKNNIKEVCRKNKKIISKFNSNPLPDKLYKVSWILTPDVSHLSKSLLKTAFNVNKKMTISFRKHIAENSNILYGNILIIDNFLKSDIMEMIYRMNKIIIY